MKGFQEGHRLRFSKNILLKNKITANQVLFLFLCLIVRLSETQVSMTNTKAGAPKNSL